MLFPPLKKSCTPSVRLLTNSPAVPVAFCPVALPDVCVWLAPEVWIISWPSSISESTTPYIGCPWKWSSVSSESTTIEIAFIFSIVMRVSASVHFSVPFTEMLAVPKMNVVPSWFRVTDVASCTAKLVMSCV